MNLRTVNALLLAGLLALGLGACKKSGEGDSAPAGGPPYQLTVTGPEGGSVGEPLKAQVQVEPRGGYKVNLEFPTKLEVKGPAGATPEAVTLRGKDAAQLTEARLLLEPTFTVAGAGEHRFSGTLKFSVCTEKLCEIKNEEVSWVAKVQ